MSFINYSSREINCKIVYYGLGFVERPQTFNSYTRRQTLNRRASLSLWLRKARGPLFFDFLPLALGDIRGFKVRFHLYTVPGQVFYAASRKLILKGVDGVIFVADSQIERMEANMESLDDLKINLAEQGYAVEKLPYAVQYNKRDLPSVAPLEEMNKLLNLNSVQWFEAVATTGVGVFETLKSVAKQVLLELKKHY